MCSGLKGHQPEHVLLIGPGERVHANSKSGVVTSPGSEPFRAERKILTCPKASRASARTAAISPQVHGGSWHAAFFVACVLYRLCVRRQAALTSLRRPCNFEGASLAMKRAKPCWQGPRPPVRNLHTLQTHNHARTHMST